MIRRASLTASKFTVLGLSAATIFTQGGRDVFLAETNRRIEIGHADAVWAHLCIATRKICSSAYTMYHQKSGATGLKEGSACKIEALSDYPKNHGELDTNSPQGKCKGRGRVLPRRFHLCLWPARPIDMQEWPQGCPVHRLGMLDLRQRFAPVRAEEA